MQADDASYPIKMGDLCPDCLAPAFYKAILYKVMTLKRRDLAVCHPRNAGLHRKRSLFYLYLNVYTVLLHPGLLDFNMVSLTLIPVSFLLVLKHKKKTVR